ncbi:hypothetical protein HWI79_509 [Cryptosporidium felis]|nr:hypothetical protein HWI79_509 [Cryptosporidium felis]
MTEMDEEFSLRTAEEKAIKEAEYIAASESIKLAQELSLRMDISETNSEKSFRTSSVAAIQDDINNPQEEGEVLEIAKSSKEEITESFKENDTEIAPEESKSVQEPVVEAAEVGEDGNSSNLINQDSKLFLSEFSHDSVNFKEEQEETTTVCEQTTVILEEPTVTEDTHQVEEDCTVLISNEEPLELRGCGHKFQDLSKSTRENVAGIIDFQKSIFNDCNAASKSINQHIKESTWNYFDYVHSKLIYLAGFHNPDECSICRDFKHQDVPLLN